MKALVSSVVLGAGLACGLQAAGATLRSGEVDVVVAPYAPGPVLLAAEEMTNFLSRALGAAVPIRRAPDPARTSVVLGTNAWSAAAGADVSGLDRDAFRLKTAGNALYVAGHDDHIPLQKVRREYWFRRGTLMGVYAFLERFAGCRFYFPGELGEIVPRTASIAVGDLDVTDTPAMEERSYAYHAAGEWFDESLPAAEADWLKRLHVFRLRLGSGKYIVCHGLRHFKYVRRFAKEHPEYFMLQKDGTRYLVDTERPPYPRNGKLCFTSGIREEIYRDVRAYLTGQGPESRGLTGWGSTCRDGNFVSVQPEDGYAPCQCPGCQAAYRMDEPAYATDLMWGFTKEIAERLAREGIDAVVFQSAYSAWSRVPDFDLPPNILVDVDVFGPWTARDPRALAGCLALLRKWTEKLGHPVLNWTYPGKYMSNSFPDAPQHSPRAYAAYYKAAAPYLSGRKSGTYAETHTDRWMFDMLNVYMLSRVTWDPSVDAEAVLDEHCRLMYGAAAPQMKRILDGLERKWMDEVQCGFTETNMGPMNRAPSTFRIWTDIYSPRALAPLVRLADEAAAAVPAGSLEARRIALMREELLERPLRHGRDYAASLSVEAEKASRVANPRPSVVTGFEPVTITVDATMTNRPVHRVTFPLALEKGATYRLSYFVRGENIVRTNPRRGGAQASPWICEAFDEGKSWPKEGLDGTFDWVHQTCGFRVPENPAGGFAPSLDVRLLNATGTAHFAGLVVERLRGPALPVQSGQYTEESNGEKVR